MDLEIPEPAAEMSLSRRGLVARVGAVGLAGLAAALVVDGGTLTASSGPDDRPSVPTASDRELLGQVIELELAASALYEAALENATDDLAVAIGVMANNHRAYAQAIAGATGISAGTADEELVADNVAGFTGSADEFFESAHELEQVLVATHTSLIGEYESSDAITLAASIAVIEARHATVLAELLGVDDLDILLGNDASPVPLSGADAS